MNYQMKFAIHTLGCKLNYSESSGISNLLIDQGFVHVPFSDLADYYIVNTCSVTEEADKKCRYLVRQIRKRTNEAKVIITGCYAQLKPEEIEKIEGVDLVLGASEKFRLHEFLCKLSENQTVEKAHVTPVRQINTFHPSFSFGERTRTFLKVQDGCDYHCTFCTIPLARGKSRSTSISKTIEQAKKALETGVKEIVLTGVNIGDFGRTEDGRQRTEENFLQLIHALDKLEADCRFRISSIEPNLLSKEIVEFVASSKSFMPHFHIPLQSGSDVLLKRMKRKYDSALYKERVEWIKYLMPSACIGVDVITGFPGESDIEFMKTYHLLEELNVSYLHVFTYSERLNTIAAELEGKVPIHIRRERNEKLRQLSESKKRSFYEANSGAVKKVLWEAETTDDFIFGYTDNYIKVSAPFSEDLVNQITESTLFYEWGKDCCQIISTETINNRKTA